MNVKIISIISLFLLSFVGCNSSELMVSSSVNNITIDGNFHKIICTNEEPNETNFGIYLNGKTGVTITNCGINYFDYGIYL